MNKKPSEGEWKDQEKFGQGVERFSEKQPYSKYAVRQKYNLRESSARISCRLGGGITGSFKTEGHFSEMQKKLDEICEDYNAQKWSVVDRRCTAWLKELCKFTSLPAEVANEAKPWCTSTHNLLAYRLRSYARVKIGDIDGAKQDATDALGMLRDGFKSESNEKDAQLKVIFLYIRGHCLTKQGNLAEGAADLEASCAGFHSNFNETWQFPGIRDINAELLKVLALQKVKEGAARPHYTLQEKDEILHQMRLCLYSNFCYKCLACGAKPTTPGVTLKRCTGCRAAWFCGSECQKKSWKVGGHREECKKGERRPVHIIMDAEKDALLERLEKDKVFKVKTAPFGRAGEDEPGFLVRDPVTGKLFDSLRDDDVIFMPSQSELYDKLQNQQGVWWCMLIQQNITGTKIGEDVFDRRM